MGKIELIDRFKMLERLQEWNTDDKQDSFLYSFALARIIEQPTVEAIPKADYENRLKADLVAMLTELSMKIGEIEDGYVEFDEENKRSLTMIPLESVERLIDEEINSLKEA